MEMTSANQRKLANEPVREGVEQLLSLHPGGQYLRDRRDSALPGGAWGYA